MATFKKILKEDLCDAYIKHFHETYFNVAQAASRYGCNHRIVHEVLRNQKPPTPVMIADMGWEVQRQEVYYFLKVIPKDYKEERLSELTDEYKAKWDEISAKKIASRDNKHLAQVRKELKRKKRLKAKAEREKNQL